MRILHVVHGFPPDQLGGTEIITRELALELAKTHSVFVFTGHAGREPCEETDEIYRGLHVRRFGTKGIEPSHGTLPDVSLKTYKNALVESRFRTYLGHIAPDVVHFQHVVGLSASLIEIVSSCSIPSVVTLRDFWFLCPRVHWLKPDLTICDGPDSGINCSVCGLAASPGGCSGTVGKARVNRVLQEIKTVISPKTRARLRNRFLTLKRTNRMPNRVFPYYLRFKYFREMLRLADVITSPSVFVKEKFVRHGVERAKIRVIRHALSADFVQGLKKGKSDRLRVGYIGRIREHKGVQSLMEAAARIDVSKVGFFIYGDGSPVYIRKLRAIAPHVSWGGRYAPEDLGKIMRNIDVLVIPSLWHETFSLVAREGLASKTPVIASRVGALPEIIDDGINGFLFEPGNHEELRRNIMKFVENPNLATTLAANIRPVRTAAELAKEMEELYCEICQLNRPQE